MLLLLLLSFGFFLILWRWIRAKNKKKIQYLCCARPLRSITVSSIFCSGGNKKRGRNRNEKGEKYFIFKSSPEGDVSWRRNKQTTHTHTHKTTKVKLHFLIFTIATDSHTDRHTCTQTHKALAVCVNERPPTLR